MTIKDILYQAVQQHASDIHLKAEKQPYIRVHGKLQPLDLALPKISKEELRAMALSLMDEQQKAQLLTKKEVDLGYGVSGLGRFRINIFQQRGSLRMVIRAISFTVPSLTELCLPPIIGKIADFERGLVLVCGATGSGKSSTLAAMMDLINRTKYKHIITLEDPIEYLIPDEKSIISQREIGIDTTNFPLALRAALRQDPDIILIGEMRDKETIDIALTAAETGHLVLSTLHTLDAQESINRILAMYEPHQLLQVRSQLGSVLRAVISQRLARRRDGRGFLPVVEVLINNKRIRDMILDPSRTNHIKTAIEEGRIGRNMQSFDQCLIQLIQQGAIDYEEALLHTDNPEDFALKCSGIADRIQSMGKSSPPSPPTPQNTSIRTNDVSGNEFSEIELDQSSYRSRKKKTS